MRIYYIFKIKKEIISNAKENPYNLYKILENINNMEDSDVVLGFKAFNKICDEIPKNDYNKLIKDINRDNLNYTCYNFMHIYNDFLKNENTKLTINNSHIKIKSNSYIPAFFLNISNIKGLFVCDFINADYFFLDEVLIKNK